MQDTLKSTPKKCLFSQLLLHPSWCNRPEKIVELLTSVVCGRKKDSAFIKLEENHYGRCVDLAAIVTSGLYLKFHISISKGVTVGSIA